MRDGRLKRVQAVVQRRSVCLRKATITASSSMLRTVEAASLGPVGRSATDPRFFHLATVFGLIRSASPAPSGSLDYVVSLDGLPLSSWRSHEELARSASLNT